MRQVLAREPYLLFFPLGIILSLAGVAPWLLFGLRASALYPSVFHALVQVECFLSSFAVGFLFTFVPRRTSTAPPRGWQMALAFAGLVGTAVFAWAAMWMTSQVCWLVAMGVTLSFVLRRVLRPGTGLVLDGRFVWIPAGLLMGLGGAVLTGVAAMGRPMLHAVGQAILTQGMFTALVLGVGQLVLPNFLYAAPARSRTRRLFGSDGALHLLVALLFASTFPLEVWISPVLCAAVRAFIVFAVVLLGMGMIRLPTVPGLHRQLIWISAWMIPIGYGLMAAFPIHRLAFEHVVFFGFALMTFGVSIHVALSHRGHGELLKARPWQTAAIGVLVLTAVLFRLLMSLDPTRYMVWMAIAAGAFLGAAVAWALLVVPRLGRTGGA
jgi:uncharacterized protein involved in response to NO